MPRAVAIALSSISLLLIVWTLYRWLTGSEEPRRLLINWGVTLICGLAILLILGLRPTPARAFIVPPIMVLFAVILTAVWAPSIGSMMAKPLTSLFDGGDEEIEPAPLYSGATNKIRKGEFQAAAFEIKEQLLKFPRDFKGQHMLAQLQAQHLNDLPGAQVTIERFLAQPGHEPQQIAFALNELAEWHVKYGQDLEAARATFKQIIGRFPDSEMAHQAHQRIAHLGTMETLLAAHDRPRIVLRRGPERLGLMKDQSTLARPPEDMAAQAEAYVNHLEENPHDHEAREKLAWIYAEHFGRLDLALDQMEQLAVDSHQPPRQRIHCLNTIADMQIKFGKNLEGARAALARIVELNPVGASADTARKRMDRLPLELKAGTQAHSIKMS